MGNSITIKRMGQAVEERFTAILQQKRPWIRSRVAEHGPGDPLSDRPLVLPTDSRLRAWRDGHLDRVSAGSGRWWR